MCALVRAGDTCQWVLTREELCYTVFDTIKTTDNIFFPLWHVLKFDIFWGIFSDLLEMDIVVTPLGAGQDVGRSCLLLSIG